MQGPHGWSIESDQATAIKDAIDVRLAEVLVMQDPAPRLQRLVGREDHGAMSTMPFVDHVKEHVGGIGSVAEIAHFIDDQHGRMGVGLQRLRELPVAKGGGEVVDQHGRGGEDGVKSWMARYAIAIAKCVLPRPVLPEKMSDRPSVTKSGASAEPSICTRSVD
jgi:hypothetical protein